MLNIEIDGIDIRVTRKKIKHIHLRVYPPDGRVALSAPVRMTDTHIREFISSRLEWIKKQRERLVLHGPGIACHYESGERHLFQGKNYQLAVIGKNRKPDVQLIGNRLLLSVRPGTDQAKREQILYTWYRRQLAARIPAIIRHYEPVMGVNVQDFNIRRMTSRWGSCNIRKARILLNLELVKKPPECLEYVVVHEMAHLLERGHNRRFFSLMTQFMPDWKTRKQKLG